MKVLKEMLKETSLDIFLEKHFTRLPFSSVHGALHLCNLLNWKTVEHILQEKKSVLRIVQDGTVIKDYVELNYSEAQKHHEQGHTLLLRYAEKSDTALFKIAQDFAQTFHTEVDIQLYCTPENHNAFGWHYDVEEVFIIQTRGSKHYTIRPNTVHPNPLVLSIPKNQGYEQEKTDLAIEVTLEEGDWLYIPSGWWHIARTKKESMHISVGLMPRSAVDIASALPKYLAQFPFWRKRLPIHLTFENEQAELDFYQEAFQKLAQDMLIKAACPEFIQSFLAQAKQQIDP
jgi:50S ribosomal protein L16 3-hydroxylase